MKNARQIPFAIAFTLLAGGSAHAQVLAPKGAKATLTVSYEYSAVGRKADKYDPAEWRVSRTLTLVVPMSAEAEQALSVTRAMEPGQQASIEKKQAQTASLHQKMEPTMNDMMKIAERCGDDEACVEKAVVEYGNHMDPALIKSSQADAAAIGKMDPPRYQLWRGLSQRGTYAIDEAYRAKTADPLCMAKPNHQCSREETRKGGGAVPSPASGKAATIAQLEVDAVKKDILLTLPVPLAALGFTRQITTDFPDEKGGASQDGLYSLPGKLPPVTAALTGDARTVSGTQTINIAGSGAEARTLTVKWQFVRQ
jgi:hypothetical protein